MKVHSLKVPYFICPIKENLDNKENFLNDFEKIGKSHKESGISLYKTNYINYQDYPKLTKMSWHNLYFNIIDKYYNRILEYLNQRELERGTPWFHQYMKGDYYGWHSHGRHNYASVYYLELPENKCKLQFYNPIDSTVMYVDVKEGDSIFFPSSIRHRSPENPLNKRKTTIACNFTVSDWSEANFRKS